MTVDEFEAAIRLGLLNVEFDFARPDPALAWKVFKSLALFSVECHESYLFWEAGKDYFDFVREFSHFSDSGNIWEEQVTVHLYCSACHNLEIQPLVVFSRDYTDYESFFVDVEARPEFDKGIRHAHWVAELRIDGC